ncbi:transposase [Kitasatospora herbaricolor]|uniref:transposase n=1 Tax=Kitasatospora herbaricolor TaxID=68217 RepID=UPI003521DE70
MEPLLAPARVGPKGGRREKHPRRIVEAVFSVARTGCAWRQLRRTRSSADGVPVLHGPHRLQRLPCGQEGEGPQEAHRHRHPPPAPGRPRRRDGAKRPCPGATRRSAWRQTAGPPAVTRPDASTVPL